MIWIISTVILYLLGGFVYYRLLDREGEPKEVEDYMAMSIFIPLWPVITTMVISYETVTNIMELFKK